MTPLIHPQLVNDPFGDPAAAQALWPYVTAFARLRIG
jgi:hypothetical protein